MTDISREQTLAHFGVKGMRWGVRNDPGSEPDPVGLEEALLGSEVPDG